MPQTPEEIAQDHNAPLIKVLIDFDLNDPNQQILGAKPVDLADIPCEPVRSLIASDVVLTIVAHQGEEQDVANLLAVRQDLVTTILSYGQEEVSNGTLKDLAVYAINMELEEIREIVQRSNGPEQEKEE